MSTITKEEVIAAIKGELSPIKIIEEYCKEFDKKDADIQKLITYLQVDISTLSHCYNVALDHFMRKYEVTLVHDKYGQLVAAL